MQRAFEVLSDSQQRTIYDLYGQRGLDAGCELGPHLTTADDIVREFEKLAYKRKMQRMQRISQARVRRRSEEIEPSNAACVFINFSREWLCFKWTRRTPLQRPFHRLRRCEWNG